MSCPHNFQKIDLIKHFNIDRKLVKAEIYQCSICGQRKTNITQEK